METRWTPGPWHRDDFGRLVNAGGKRVAIPIGGTVPRALEADIETEALANGKLLEAAPELFDALAEILDVINANDGDDPDGLVALMESGRAALAKALGEKA